MARALGTLPLLARALARGELSYAKVRALTRVPKAGDRVVPQRLHQGGPGATVIVPVPPSRSSRPQQPVSTIAAALSGQLSIAVEQNAITRAREVPRTRT